MNLNAWKHFSKYTSGPPENQMMHTVGELLGSPVTATHGLVGRVLDAFFDEQSWQIRYLLVETSSAGRDRIVAFRSEAVVSIDAEEGLRVEGSPAFDLKSSERLHCLRSTRAVLDCTVAGWSGSLGTTADALFDEASWALRFLMIDASSWCPGVVVLLRPDLVQEAHWERQSLRVAITRVEVLNMSEADPTEIDTAHAERVLH
jgi:hypothetical protein